MLLLLFIEHNSNSDSNSNSNSNSNRPLLLTPPFCSPLTLPTSRIPSESMSRDLSIPSHPGAVLSRVDRWKTTDIAPLGGIGYSNRCLKKGALGWIQRGGGQQRGGLLSRHLFIVVNMERSYYDEQMPNEQWSARWNKCLVNNNMLCMCNVLYPPQGVGGGTSVA